ncbi:hypothetical protein C3L33_22662, partial [Rhododendron williamsianum]
MKKENYVPLFETKAAKGRLAYQVYAASSSGLLSTGLSHNLFGGIPSTVIPSKTGYLKADHTVEPPLIMVNTVLSVMAYDYPVEKLSVYVSDDDGGSELMFYALLEASYFSKYWLPYCN